MRFHRQLIMLFVWATLVGSAPAQHISTPPDTQPERETTDSADLQLRDFRPRSTLKVPQSNLQHAKFPVIDVHNHMFFHYKGDQSLVVEYLQLMRENRIAIAISLDAVLGQEEDHLQYLNQAESNHRGKSEQGGPQLVSFVHIDFIGKGDKKDPQTWSSSQSGFVRQCVEQLKAAAPKGILGVKFFKMFGLRYKNADGSLMKIDDPRWDPIWEACGQLKLPVIIHTADPVAFFQPIDKTNERWEELQRHPDWSFYGQEFPSREELLDARNRVIERHPDTTFIGAHVANNGEDLAKVSNWLERYPNLVVEIASRINELGRQPYSARDFFLKYQDRILFGTDGPWEDARLKLYWRFLETKDQYFDYSDKQPPPQGFWQIYGIGLPEEVLKKIYYENALRIMPRLKPIYAEAIRQAND